MRGHRYAGAGFARDFGRHFGAPDIPKPVATTNAPLKTDAAIQAERAAAKLEATRRTGRRATVLTSGREVAAPTMAGSITAPGASARLGV